MHEWDGLIFCNHVFAFTHQQNQDLSWTTWYFFWKGKLIFANFGSEEDYKALHDAGVDTNGTIALVKYGGGVGRGGKASIGAKYGIVGALVYSDPESYVADQEVGKSISKYIVNIVHL